LDRFKTSTSRQLRFTLPSNAALGFSGHGPSALNTHGTHAVQKLVETLRSPEQVRPNHLRRPASTLHREREEWTWWTHTGGGNALAFEQPPICDRLHCIPVEYHTARQCDGGWACSHGVDEWWQFSRSLSPSHVLSPIAGTRAHLDLPPQCPGQCRDQRAAEHTRSFPRALPPPLACTTWRVAAARSLRRRLPNAVQPMPMHWGACWSRWTTALQRTCRCSRYATLPVDSRGQWRLAAVCGWLLGCAWGAGVARG
jgi:hypothetical protein